MGLQTSGQISMYDIANEKQETLSDVSLAVLSEVNLNGDPCNPANSTAGEPYGISEFYGYDHNCVSGPNTFEIPMFGTYRAGEEACEDKGKNAERWVLYTNCNPDEIGIGPGCLIYADSVASEPFFEEGWYFYPETVTSYFISGGEVIDRIPCFK